MSFDDRQRGYYLREINRALPARTNGTIPDDSTIALALGNVDPVMPGSVGAPAAEAHQFLSYYGNSAAAYSADAACRELTDPTKLRSDPTARTGCGWYFRNDPNYASTAAYGTRRGPMSPVLDSAGVGQWVWDPMEAALMESQKQAAKITSCSQLQFNSYPNMGWCPSTGSALATDGQGNPLFPRAQGGDCPGGGIITNAAQCPAPGGPSASGGTGGGSGPMTNICTPNPDGTLPAACLVAIAQQSGLSPNGSLIQELNATGTLNTATAYLPLLGTTINLNTSSPQLWATACQQIKAATLSQGRGGAAASNLAYGTPFDPCALRPTDTSPFPPECVTKSALSKGFSPQGLAMPAQAGMGFWNNLANYNGQSFGDNTWQSALNQMDSMKRYADVAGYGTPDQQRVGIAQVYGTSVQYPKTDCNNAGVMLYRYYFPPTWNWALMPPQGLQTHFLGRYIFKKGLPSTEAGSSLPFSWSTMKDQAPSGGNLTEAHKLECDFKVIQPTTHQFQLQVDDFCNMYIDGQLYLQVGCCGQMVNGPVVNWGANETHRLTWVYINGGGPWSFGCHLSVGGEAFDVIPAEQMYMTQDRRKPTLGLEFAKPLLTSTAGADFVDTNNVLTNWDLEGSSQISQGYGQQCLIVSPSSGLYNYKTYNQGISSHALRSMTCRLYVDSVTPGTWPSVWEFFNLGGSQPYSNPRQGAPTESFAWGNRRDVTALVINSNGLVCYGIMNQGTGLQWQTTKLNVSLPMKQWCHVAVVWDDDWQGFALYVNGQLADRFRMAKPLPNFLMEQLCVGSLDNEDGSGWTGGIAWWRGFDYRLSTDQIALDMNDNWDSLY